MAGEADSSTDERGADVALKFMGNEVNVKNVKSLNTFATIMSLVGTCCIGVFLYFHEATAQSQRSELAATLKESQKVIADTLKESNAQFIQSMKEDRATALEAQRAVVNELKKGANASKETACLLDPAMKNRTDAREFCKRIVRDDR